jgi:hypothetical protein
VRERRFFGFRTRPPPGQAANGKSECRLPAPLAIRSPAVRDITGRHATAVSAARRRGGDHVPERVLGPSTLQRRSSRLGPASYAYTARCAQRGSACRRCSIHAPMHATRTNDGYGPRVTILATEGTPAPLIRNSIYGPGGARLPFRGATAVRLVELVAVKVRG